MVDDDLPAVAKAGERRAPCRREHFRDRRQRGHAGPAAEAKHITARPGIGGHGSLGPAEQHAVAGARVIDEGAADQPGGHRPDMQRECPVRARRTGERVATPLAWPSRRLHPDVLARPVGKPPVGAQRQHGDVGGGQVMPGHLGRPPGRCGHGVGVGRVDHDGRGPVEGGEHGGLVGGPQPEPAAGRPQRGPERQVVLLAHPVLAVRPAQCVQVPARQPAGQRAVEAARLAAHGRGEHRPDLRLGGEHMTVEERHRHVGQGAGSGDRGISRCRTRGHGGCHTGQSGIRKAAGKRNPCFYSGSW